MQSKFKLSYIWVTGIFVILLIILLLVIEYKVKYEDNTFYKYLYFYKCNNNFCTTDDINNIKDQSTLLSVYKYDYNANIPTYQYVVDKYIIINDNGNYLYYDYINGEIINDYEEYQIIKDNEIVNYIIIKNNNKYGIIDIDNNSKLDIDNDYIEYIEGNIIVIKENKLDILSTNLESKLDSTLDINYNKNINIAFKNNIIEININNNIYEFDTNSNSFK